MLLLDKLLEEFHLPQLGSARLLTPCSAFLYSIEESLEVLGVCFLEVLPQLALALRIAWDG